MPILLQCRIVSMSNIVILHILILKGHGGVDMSEAGGGYGYGAGFALIVVLFILLIIVGSAYVGYGY